MILISLALLLLFVLIGFVGGLVGYPLARGGQFGTVTASSFAVSVLEYVIFLTLSPVLPAAAVDKSFTFSEAVFALSGNLGALMICALALTGLDHLGNAGAGWAYAFGLQSVRVVEGLVAIITAIIGVSLLALLRLIQECALGPSLLG